MLGFLDQPNLRAICDRTIFFYHYYVEPIWGIKTMKRQYRGEKLPQRLRDKGITSISFAPVKLPNGDVAAPIQVAGANGRDITDSFTPQELAQIIEALPK